MPRVLCSLSGVRVDVPGPEGKVTLLDGVSLDITEGGHTAVLGANGSGKSTLLRLIGGDLWKSGGEIIWYTEEGAETSRIAGRAVTATVSPRLQEEFQLHGWNISGRELLETGFDGTYMLYTATDGFKKRIVEETAELLEAGPLMDCSIQTMSQGQLRLLLIGRALVRRPKILLLDECYDGLDERHRRLLDAALAKASQKSTLVMTSHRADRIPAWCQKRVWMGDGCLSDHPLAPKSAMTAVRGLADAMPPVDEGATPIVRLKGDVYKDGELLLRDLDWELRPGERWVLTGENGSGKSTFLRLLAGDEIVAWPGSISFSFPGRIEGEIALEHLRRHVHLVSDLSQACYDDDLTCLELVLSGFDNTVGVYREFTREEQGEAQELLALAGLTDARDRSFHSLSTGQARRLFLVRAMAGHPSLLLLDEPLSGLDAASRAEYLNVLAGAARAGVSYVFVSHFGEDLPPGANRKGVMKDGRLTVER